MIRSSALYVSLIISIFIALVCGSILLAGFVYKMQESKIKRGEMLLRNAASASVLVMQDSIAYGSVKHIKLFDDQNETGDSVTIEKRQWGLYELGLVVSFKNTDSVKRAFLIGSSLKDSAMALYIADEDRPLSISGKSRIQGVAYLPKSGIKSAYVESSYYEGKQLVFGRTGESSRELPLPDTNMINGFKDLLSASNYPREEDLPESLSYSFFLPVKRIHLPINQPLISNKRISGNIIISSDSLIQVESSSKLDKVILVAPYVKISSGFKGSLQVIASDSISIGPSVQLTYPSALVLIKPDTAGFQPKISIGKNSVLRGQAFAWEKQRSQMMPIIEIGHGAIIKGEIWSKGYVQLGKSSLINGSVSAIHLMANISSIKYENYLIDAIINRDGLSKYYTGSKLFNSAHKPGSILWHLH